MAKAVAQLQGRDYVIPSDVQETFAATLAHRLQISAEAEMKDMNIKQVLKSIQDSVPAPELR